jgi:hypothetical protein
MKTDYTCLQFVKADMDLYEDVNLPYPPVMLIAAVQTVIEYLLDRDQPKRELILMESKLKSIKKDIKKQVGMKARKELKKQVRSLGKLPKARKTDKTKKRAKASIASKKKPSSNYAK